MNLQETACFVQQIDVIKPRYFEWRQAIAEQQAAAHDKTPPQIMGQLVEALSNELAELSSGEAGDAIDAITEGKLQLAEWADLGQRVRSWVVEQRAQRKASKLHRDPADQPRYRCLNCRDTGVVLVFNVFFVREFRRVFEALGDKCPPNFRRTCNHFATMHHGKHVTLPLSHVGICDCDGDRSQYNRQQLSDWEAGRLKQGRYPIGGTFEWKPAKCPIFPDGTDEGMFEALAKWYAANRELF